MTIEEMKLHHALATAPLEAVTAVLELEPLAALAAQTRSAEALLLEVAPHVA